MSDRGLIRRMKAGDKEAASIFTDKYYLDIYKYCYWKVGEKTLSEDLTQEVFVRFLPTWNNMSTRERPKIICISLLGIPAKIISGKGRKNPGRNRTSLCLKPVFPRQKTELKYAGP